MKIEIEREEDGRWIAEIPELPGVMVYGDSRNEANPWAWVRNSDIIRLNKI